MKAAALALGTLLAAGALAAERPAAPRHVIVISIDTLRPDRLGCYGHERPTSPTIDRLAGEGLRFADASAPSPWTKPSHASLFTGLYPVRHGAARMEGSMHAAATTLAERLHEAGFATAAVVNASWLKMQGLERGFEHFEWVRYEQGTRAPSPVTDRVLDWLRGFDAKSKRLFLFVHFMDVHSDYTSLPRHEKRFLRPYDGEFDGSTSQLYELAEGKRSASADDVRHLFDLYDAGIRQVDGELERLVAALGARGLLDDAWLVLTSDHGEEFLEHGSAVHGHTQYEEVLRVPLLLRGPGVPRGTVETPVSLVDVAPTLLTALGVPGARGLDGVALQPLWTGNAERPELRRVLFGEADVTFPPPGPGFVPPGSRRSARAGRFKLHVDLATAAVRLFDLGADPGERDDVSDAHPKRTRVLLDKLRGHLRGGEGSDALSAAEAELLDVSPRPVFRARP